MKTLKTTLIALLTFISAIACAQNANQPTTMDLLTAVKWQAVSKDGTQRNEYYNLYDQQTRTSILYYQNTETTSQGKYYLSNNIELSFNETKVGKAVNGKYIISLITEGEEPIVAEIMKLTNSVLIIKRKANDGKIANNSNSMTFKPALD